MTARKKRRGFSLIEAAIVLGVVGLVIGGIWVAAAKVSFDMKVNRTKQAYLELREVGFKLYPPWTADSVTNVGQFASAAIAGGLVPVDLTKNGTAISPFGLRWDLTTFTAGGYAPSFTISVTIELPRSACIQIVMWVLNLRNEDNRFAGLWSSDSGQYMSVMAGNINRVVTNSDISSTICVSENPYVGLLFTP